MANQITGKIIQIYPQETIPSKNGGKDIVKRAILIDCTRFDPYTGERGYENTPLLEFIGEKCSELNNFQAGQVVTITFDVQGVKYTKDGVENIFTRVQPYKIEARQVQRAQPIQQPQMAQPQHQAQPPYQQPQQPQRQYQQYQQYQHDPNTPPF